MNDRFRPKAVIRGGRCAAAWLRFAACLPIHFYPADTRGRTAALDVRDLGEAMVALCEARHKAEWREVELGGGARTRSYVG